MKPTFLEQPRAWTQAQRELADPARLACGIQHFTGARGARLSAIGAYALAAAVGAAGALAVLSWATPCAVGTLC